MDECQYLPFHSDVSRRYWTRQEKWDPRDCDNYKYVRHIETVESHQQKRKPWNSMEAMLPQSFGTSESEILGVIVCQWWIPRRWMQACSLRGGGAGLYWSPWNSPLTHYDSEDFWVWPAKGLRKHCFDTVLWLLFLLTTFDCFST